MGIVKVDVKWQKESFNNVEVDLDQPPSVFKMQLFSLTGVPPERQKIIGFKGGLLKDDTDWATAGAKDGLKVTMMGTADKVPQAPKKEQIFLEDLPEDEQDTTGLSKYGAGLENLGNTCYMNSTLQCLYNVPELKAKLTAFRPNDAKSEPGQALTSAAGSLFSNMDRSAQAVSPMEFVMTLRGMFPQFDQRSREGFHMQQDAEECWGNLLLVMRNTMKVDDGFGSEIQNLFGIRIKSVLKCDETDETMELEDTELMLKCNIDSTVNHLSEGIKLGLQGDREKTSSTLGRLAVFRGEGRIESLPPYLTVQLVRFFYKTDVQQKAKILRKVAFPMLLDMYDLCSDEMKESLNNPRLALKEIEDAKAGVSKKQKTTPDSTASGSEVASVDPKAYVGSLTGRYELIGVLTHKGRSADSGHYVSWTKKEDGQWIQFDDDQMIPRKDEEVLALSGGGDWHMAYLLLYKAQKVPPIDDKDSEKPTDNNTETMQD